MNAPMTKKLETLTGDQDLRDLEAGPPRGAGALEAIVGPSRRRLILLDRIVVAFSLTIGLLFALVFHRAGKDATAVGWLVGVTVVLAAPLLVYNQKRRRDMARLVTHGVVHEGTVVSVESAGGRGLSAWNVTVSYQDGARDRLARARNRVPRLGGVEPGIGVVVLVDPEQPTRVGVILPAKDEGTFDLYTEPGEAI